MNYNLKNYVFLKTWKTFNSRIYKISRSLILSFLKSKLNIIYTRNYLVYILEDLLFFKKTNLTNYILDNIQEVNYKTLIFLPIKVKNLKTNKSYIVYYLLGEVPTLSLNKNLIINGFRKTYIPKIVLNKTGIFFNTFLKEDANIFYAKVKHTNYNFTYSIVLTENECFFIHGNYSCRLNIILLLLGISLQDIRKYSRYRDSFYFRSLILKVNSKLENIVSYNIKFLFFILNSNFFLNKNNFGTLKKILKSFSNLNNSLFFNLNKLISIDLIYVLDFLLDIKFNKIKIEDIENNSSIKNITTLSEYFSTQYSIFLNKKFKILERDMYNINKFLINKKEFITPVYIKSEIYFSLSKYLAVNPSVQYLEQINSFSEINHKDRIINYNSKIKKNLELRDVSLSQLGSICLINTSESINCGLLLNLSKNVLLKNNTINFTYNNNKKKHKGSWIKFTNFFNIRNYDIFFDASYTKRNKIINHIYLGLNKENFKLRNTLLKKTIHLNTSNLFSYAENLIPFLFFNEPARSLMGSKMQTQSVPLLKNNKSLLITGNEKNTIIFNPVILKAYQEGIINSVNSSRIVLKDFYHRKIIYYLNKYKRSNNGTLIHQKPIVWEGERILSGQVLTHTQDILDTEFTSGNNLIISYGNFFGFNFEDALVLNQRVLYFNLYTSLHFNIYEVNIRNSNEFKYEVTTNNVPKKNIFCRRNLDNFGIIKEGSKILDNDILVSKIILNELKVSEIPLYTLISLLLGTEIRNIKDNSILISLGNSGRIVKTEIFQHFEKKSSLLKCRIYVCKQRLLSLGDKLCGRYGNKGVLAYIISSKDMPYSNNGNIPDIITDSLGIPSRLNIGQLFESLLGLRCLLTAKRLSITNKIKLPKNYLKLLINQYIKQTKEELGNTWIYNSYIPGQMFLRDGRTGHKFLEPSFIGVSKYSKLIHMIKDKIHYRTIGPYTEIMQQPVKGRNKLGGQRFGEMEIWALEAYGSSYNLRELLNYKSDDLFSRGNLENRIFSSITIPESFRTIIRELHTLNLNFEASFNTDILNGNLVPFNINF